MAVTSSLGTRLDGCRGSVQKQGLANDEKEITGKQPHAPARVAESGDVWNGSARGHSAVKGIIQTGHPQSRSIVSVPSDSFSNLRSTQEADVIRDITLESLLNRYHIHSHVQGMFCPAQENAMNGTYVAIIPPPRHSDVSILRHTIVRGIEIDPPASRAPCRTPGM
jgi:hypothetical protein